VNDVGPTLTMRRITTFVAAAAFSATLFASSAGFSVESAGVAHGSSAAPNYPRAAEPAVVPAFTPLPLGRVEPQGWLRDWAVAAKDGITGHLDERNTVFHDGWKGTPVKYRGGTPDGTGWPIEQCAYWLDGAIRLGYILHDEPLIQKVRARLDPIVDGVNGADFGTTFIYWKKNWKPSGFDSWAHSHMGRALFGLYSGSGEKRVLDAMVKVYADYPEKMDGLEFGGVSGLCNLDAMMETYALSGDPRILARAKAAINQPWVQGSVGNWLAGKVPYGHMVITYENIRLPAIMSPWTGDAAGLKASEAAFRWLDDNHMMPYGLASGEEHAAGVGAVRKTETCDIPAMLVSANWMYRIEGDGVWGDRMEKAFFNAGPSPVSRDFQTAAYYQSPNRIKLGSLPNESNHPSDTGTSGIKFGPLACPDVLCCIGACNRILPYFLANLWMATEDNGLAATLYGPCSVNALAGRHVPVKIACATDYPFTETIRISVEPESDAEFPLYLRIPRWCVTPQIDVNGEKVEAQAAAGKPGFVRLVRTWKKGDAIALTLPMAPTVSRGYEGPYQPSQRGYPGFAWVSDELFKPRALPYACVNCGPLLFSLPFPEQDDNTPAEGAKYQYALDLPPTEAAQVQVTRRPMPAHWDWPYDAPVSLEVPARPFDWKPTNTQDLPSAPVEGGEREMLKLVPYGCTKFHISMFPVTPHAWGQRP
jgi:hypothetical protein